MAVARVASAESLRTGVEDPYTFSYAGGTPQGIVVGVIHAATTVLVNTITYGGQSLSLVVQAQDTAGEANTSQLWFLGTGVPAGTQDVVADLIGATTTDIYFVVWELSGSADLEVIDFDVVENNTANPQLTLQAGGREKLSLALIGSGLAEPASLTEVTGNTRDQDQDFGSWCGVSCYETTVDASDHTIGWSGGNDDVALVAVAISEVAAPRIGQVSWAEFEVPNAPREGQVSWAELEVPTAPREAQVSWGEFEVPNAPRRGQVSWAEFEIPTLAVDRLGQVSWAELEVPNAPRIGQVSWAEMELPNAPRVAQVSWAEFEVPLGGRQGQVSWAEFEVPELPPRIAQVSWAELQVPSVGGVGLPPSRMLLGVGQ